MRFVILIVILSLLTLSCGKSREKDVSYLVTAAISGFELNYRNADGILVNEQVQTASIEDRWEYSFMADEGDIVFVSAIYKDINSQINVRILIDGKVYKQGSSKYDTVRYVTVSGTVPFE
jgi:hypothetical protein